MTAMMDAMRGFPCHQMGGMWMGDCTFDEYGQPILKDAAPHEASSSVLPEHYDTSTDGLPHATQPIVVPLRDGDSYGLTAGFVQQQVGGRTLRRLAYNEMIPGPILQVPQGAQITLHFTNTIDEETTIHSHGLRGDYTMDGVPGNPSPAVQPGQTFSYTLEFPDAGVFWYHPHVREDRQQDGGLYGNYLVEPSMPDYWTAGVREESWILDDLSLEPYRTDTIDHAMMGRYGSVQLLNNEQAFQATAQAGETVRYFVTNTANARPFRLQVDGAQMKVVGGDLGRAEHEQLVGPEGITIAPAERWILEVYYPETGSYSIRNNTPEGTVTLGTVTVSSTAESDARVLFDTLRDNSADYAELRQYIATLEGQPAEKHLRMSIDMPGMGQGMGSHRMHGQAATETDGIEWSDPMEAMNRMSTSENTTWQLIDTDTGAVNEAIDWRFAEGERVVIEVYNDPQSMHPMQHPLHFHGQRFVVLSRDGEPNSSLQWKDTVLIPAGQRVRLLLENTTPGVWMAHCHIAEHLHSGMMFPFTVGEYTVPEALRGH